MKKPDLNGGREMLKDTSGGMRPPAASTVNKDTTRSKTAATPRTLGPRVA